MLLFIEIDWDKQPDKIDRDALQIPGKIHHYNPAWIPVGSFIRQVVNRRSVHAGGNKSPVGADIICTGKIDEDILRLIGFGHASALVDQLVHIPGFIIRNKTVPFGHILHMAIQVTD